MENIILKQTTVSEEMINEISMSYFYLKEGFSLYRQNDESMVTIKQPIQKKGLAMMEVKYEEPIAHKYMDVNKDLQTSRNNPMQSEVPIEHTYLQPVIKPAPCDGGETRLSGQPNVYEEIK